MGEKLMPEVRIGTSWTNAKGQTWTVEGWVPPGRANIRSGYRFGQMNIRDIRAAIAKAEANPNG